MRFAGERKPGLRGRAERERIRIHGGAEPDRPAIERDLDEFRQRLRELKLTPTAAADEDGPS